MERKCKCEYCTKWFPLQGRLTEKLKDGPDAKLLEEFFSHEAHQSDELCCANGKLDGNWPGWEFMKEYNVTKMPEAVTLLQQLFNIDHLETDEERLDVILKVQTFLEDKEFIGPTSICGRHEV